MCTWFPIRHGGFWYAHYRYSWPFTPPDSGIDWFVLMKKKFWPAQICGGGPIDAYRKCYLFVFFKTKIDATGNAKHKSVYLCQKMVNGCTSNYRHGLYSLRPVNVCFHQQNKKCGVNLYETRNLLTLSRRIERGISFANLRWFSASQTFLILSCISFASIRRTYLSKTTVKFRSL